MSGQYYDEKCNDTDFVKDVFRMARAQNSQVKLFFNDFQCITSGAQTEVKYNTLM